MDQAFGPFVLTRLIGRGGMAEVFLAARRDEEAEGPLVLKRLRPEVAHDEEYTRRLRFEAQVASRLSHENLVKLLEFGRVGDCHYLVMEQVKGWSLKRLMDSVIEADRPPPLSVSVGIARGILAGLRAMHDAKDDAGASRPFLHRDITPGNVIIDHRGRAVLIDFGIAKDMFGPAITRIGRIVGTARYMAPEHRMGQQCDPRADVFSASLIFFELLAGRFPWPHLSPTREILRTVFDPPEVTEVIAERIPADLRAVVWKGLACAADDRFKDAHEMLAALEATDSFAALAPDLEAQTAAWVAQTALVSDEALDALVIDSAPSGTIAEPERKDLVWSPEGKLADHASASAVANELTTDDLPDANVLSIPPLPPRRRAEPSQEMPPARPKGGKKRMVTLTALAVGCALLIVIVIKVASSAS